jgi:hypothetical protein
MNKLLETICFMLIAINCSVDKDLKFTLAINNNLILKKYCDMNFSGSFLNWDVVAEANQAVATSSYF